MDPTAAYLQGYEAFFIPFWKPGWRNRHPRRSQEWADWNDGYNHAKDSFAW